jgi:hypothetical protein
MESECMQERVGRLEDTVIKLCDLVTKLQTKPPVMENLPSSLNKV